MIIIAQPKSASTSLLKTISKIVNVRFRNGMSKGKNDKDCEGFEELQKYHTTTHARSEKFLAEYGTDKNIIYKEHILPTKAHIAIIKKHKLRVVILLREPEHTIDNYRRLLDDYQNGKLNEHDIKELFVEKLSSLDFEKLSEDIRDYNKLWKEADIKTALYLDYKDIVLSPWHACRRVVTHFGYKIKFPKKVELIKARGNRGYNTFTGVGLQRLRNEKA